MNIPIQFAFEYEVTKMDPDTGDHSTSYVWTTIFNKQALMTENVIEVKLKQTTNDRGN